ncbi:hypothetical protein FBU30_003241 [Linnemannia zychae]|nr:hypothetical protein FBU30_003241 [Linnemannia zychae]
MHKLFHGGRNHTPSHVNKPLPEPLVDPDEGKTPIGELVIVPIQGRDLPNRERFGKQDPFILFKLGNVSKRTSTDVRGGQRPRWKDEQINIKLYESDAKDATSLYVTCLDEDHQKNDFIGDCVINLAKDTNNPTHRQNRHPSTPASNGAPARRPVHPTNGPVKVDDHPSASVSTATNTNLATVATTTNPSPISNAPMYRPPENVGPSLSVPHNTAGGFYPYGPSQQGGRISPQGQSGRISPHGHGVDGRISPHGHDGRVSPSGQNGRISPSHQNHGGGYPPLYPQYQQNQQIHPMPGPTALYPPPGPGYPPAGFADYPLQQNQNTGYPPQQSQNTGYPPMQPTMNQGYPPINSPFGQMPTGYPPTTFPSTGYPPRPMGHVGGLYPPVQLPLQTTPIPTGPSLGGYPPVGYPFGASPGIYPPQAPTQQTPIGNYNVDQSSSDNYKVEHTSSDNYKVEQLPSENYKVEHNPQNNVPSGRTDKNQAKPTSTTGTTLPGAWPASADPPMLPPRTQATNPPTLPPRNSQGRK